jgi:4-aminobutyrate aminotransferase-like enzyme
VVRLLPPLTIGAAEIDRASDLLSEVLTAVQSEVQV